MTIGLSQLSIRTPAPGARGSGSESMSDQAPSSYFDLVS